jgi:hypothetical protein
MAEMQVQGLSRGTSVRPHGCKREAPTTFGRAKALPTPAKTSSQLVPQSSK